MKIILSRKGFDSTYGGCPSPIIENKLVSLPIPEDVENKIPYNKVEICGYNIGDLLRQAGIIPKEYGKEINRCHLDPDIEAGLFGQGFAAAQHLRNQQVELGDLFLFFGWFRELDMQNHKFINENKHCIYAYLQIKEILDLNDKQQRERAKTLSETHPHIIDAKEFYDKESEHQKPENSNLNLLFVASPTLSWDDNIKGCGRLKYSEQTTLTKPNEARSIWQLPAYFMDAKMSYHSNTNRWTRLDDKTCQLRSVSRGQEFVIEENKAIEKWAMDLIRENIL